MVSCEEALLSFFQSVPICRLVKLNFDNISTISGSRLASLLVTPVTTLAAGKDEMPFGNNLVFGYMCTSDLNGPNSTGTISYFPSKAVGAQ